MTNFLTPLVMEPLSPFIEIVLTITLNLLTDEAAKLLEKTKKYICSI